MVRVHNLTVEQAYTQEQENHTVTQGAEIKNQYRILKTLIYGMKYMKLYILVHKCIDHFCTPYIEYNEFASLIHVLYGFWLSRNYLFPGISKPNLFFESAYS